MIRRMARAGLRSAGRQSGPPQQWGPVGWLLGALVLFVAPVVAWPRASLIVIGVLTGFTVMFVMIGRTQQADKAKSRDQALADLMKDNQEGPR